VPIINRLDNDQQSVDAITPSPNFNVLAHASTGTYYFTSSRFLKNCTTVWQKTKDKRHSLGFEFFGAAQCHAQPGNR